MTEDEAHAAVGRLVWWDDPDDGLCSGFKLLTAVDNEVDPVVVTLDYNTGARLEEIT